MTAGPEIPSLSSLPQKVNRWRSSHTVLFISVIVVLVIAMAVVYFYVRTGEVPAIPLISNKKPSSVEIKTEYSNPFDRSTQYVNPFEEFKSPFTVLQK